jgi:hypothetical protein
MRVAGFGAALLLTLTAGCGNTFNPTKPTNTRDAALRAAKDAYFYAKQQGVDMREAPCIFSNGGSWIVVVDVTAKRTLNEALKLCDAGSDGAKHAVVLDRNGTVLIAA